MKPGDEFSGRRFGRAAAIRIGVFLAVTFVAPFSLYVLDRLSGSDIGIDEVIALVTKTPFGFFLYILLVLSMIRPSWRRMRALGLPGWSGLAVPFLLFADLPYLLAARSSSLWGSSFGGLNAAIPIYMATALGLIAALTFVRAPADGERPFARFGLAGKGAVVMFAFIVIYIVQMVTFANLLAYLKPRLEEGDPSLGLFLSIVKETYWLLLLNPYACLAFVVLLAWCVIESRRRTDSARSV